VKAWLSDYGVQYTALDLNGDAEAQAEFLRRGFMLPPVVAVGEMSVSGYDPAALARLIGVEAYTDETGS
jgi:hypothetical protein